MTPLPTATYRLQLRNGVDFAAAERFLPVLAAYRISHLYLSPIFTATHGSTHGYDITDPTTIDPALGGRAGFEALCRAARAEGVGIILDIVPNHTAFSVENPWLRDVLRNGRESAFADHFEIDWSQPIALPFLGHTFEACCAGGEVAIAEGPDGPAMTVNGLAIPLAPGSREQGGDLSAVHDRQVWRLVPWTLERDAISHRRFFSVTGLIGMRVEERRVFDDMHRLTLDLVRGGLVHGLRVDHIDGLADPAEYLGRIAGAAGDIPIWVEKILVSDERRPCWPVAGTTGYEAAQKISQLLTDPQGHAALLGAWQEVTGETRRFHAVVDEAKGEVLRNDLAAELHQLIALATEALDAAGEMHGPESVREAVLALLVAFPRYRSYLTGRDGAPGDRTLWDAVRDAAAGTVRLRGTVDAVAARIVAPDSAAALALQTRIQQVTGAVLAKAHEDTAAFRHTAYLAANEVGADPDRPAAPPEAVAAWLKERGAGGLTLTSSHDTKRSEDARMRLVALSHAPDAFMGLWEIACALPEADGTDPALRWYLVQSAIALWDGGSDEMQERLADHMVKAAREGKAVSTWVAPDDAAESGLRALARAVCRAWAGAPPPELARLVAIGDQLGLVQLGLKCLMPGIPDFYGEAVGRHLALTDPDNRRPFDPLELVTATDTDGPETEKARLTRDLMRLRAEDPEFFGAAEVSLADDDGDLVLTRATPARRIVLRVRRGALAEGRMTLELRDPGAPPQATNT